MLLPIKKDIRGRQHKDEIMIGFKMMLVLNMATSIRLMTGNRDAIATPNSTLESDSDTDRVSAVGVPEAIPLITYVAKIYKGWKGMESA